MSKKHPPTVKLPKTPGATADALYAQRAARLALEAKAEALKANETALKTHLFKLLPKLEATAISGKTATVTLERMRVPSIKDWDETCKHLKKTGDFELIKRSVNAKAWRERLDAGKLVPGTEVFIEYKVHCGKRAES